MSKTVIGPVVAFLIVALEVVFGIKIPEDLGGQITDWAVAGVALVYVLYGIFKNHSKKDDLPK